MKFLAMLLLWPLANVHVHAYTLPGMFYPALLSRHLGRSRPVQVTIDQTRLVLYRNASGHVLAHTDTCPHQAASFARVGFLRGGKLVCGYHGFCFPNGKFGLHQLPLYETLEFRDNIFVKTPVANANNHFPEAVTQWSSLDVLPESRNASFRVIRGCRTIPQHHQIVTENLLDMCHVSFVHKAFGNRDRPRPFDVRFEPLHDFAGRSTFRYCPRPGGLASVLSPAHQDVVVENEFYLPGTTITRVTTGTGMVKTVLTRALPISANETRLFWEIHRNFWTDPCGIGDALMAHLMDATLNEDVGILRHVDASFSYKHSIQTRFDVTILKYRDAVERFQRNREKLGGSSL